MTKIKTILIALIVALAAVSGTVAADNYNDGDESIAVIAEWDDGMVDPGDTATLEVENIDDPDTDYVDVTVRSSGTDTYWVDYDDLDLSVADGDTVEVSSDDGFALDVQEHSLEYSGAEELETDGNISSNVSSGEVVDDPLDVEIVVYDGSDEVASDQLSIDSESSGEIVIDSGLEETTNVTVQIDGVTDDENNDEQFDSLTSASFTLDDALGIGAGDGDQTMIIIAAVLAGAALLIAKD